MARRAGSFALASSSWTSGVMAEPWLIATRYPPAKGSCAGPASQATRRRWHAADQARFLVAALRPPREDAVRCKRRARMIAQQRNASIARIVVLAAVAGIAWSQSREPARAAGDRTRGLDCQQMLAELQTLGGEL